MLNQVTLQGRLTRDVELRRTTTGKAVASFSLAVDRDGEGVDFIDCVAFEKTADHIANYFYKGKSAIVTGRLQIRTWEGKDGRKNRASEVVVARIWFAGSKDEQKPKTSVADFAELDDDDDQLPFA